MNLKLLPLDKTINYKTANGEIHCLGRVRCNITIGFKTRNTQLYVLKGLRHPFLLGLDLISAFSLEISPNLRIFQHLDTKGVEQKEELQPSKDHEKNLEKNLQILSVPITPTHFTRINRLIQRFSSLFATDKYDIGLISVNRCDIELNSHVPINLRPYRCNPMEKKMLEDQIQNLLNHGLIQKSTSQYAFPVTLVKKKDAENKERLCIDFRKLNAITTPDNHPFPRIEDIVDQLRDDEVFTILDMNSGFWHIRMNPKDIYKTAFVTPSDHYEWLVMPFGLRNAPAIFQRAIHNLLKRQNLTSFCKNYLDDILIHSRDINQHLLHLEQVFKTLQLENVKLKLSKCQFAQPVVNYLGHVVSKNKIQPLNDNTKSINEFPSPNNLKSVQRFLGKVNFYHKFIPNAPTLLAPLYQLLKKNQKFNWTEECEEAFQKVKTFLVKQPILAIYNSDAPCYLFTDASKFGVGAVLKQPQADKQLHPIGYFSKKLLQYQKNYSSTELECLAIIESIEYWHHYLYGKKFTVITDHQALRWLRNIKKPNSRLFNWSLRLSQYDFNVEYRPGKLNQEADCLSRNPFENEEDYDINLLDIKELEIESAKLEVPKHFIRGHNLIIQRRRTLPKVYVPPTLQQKLIENAHLKFGHIGTQKLMDLLSPYYIWPEINQDIATYCRNCEVCIKNKTPRGKEPGQLSQLGPAKHPFDLISIDTVGGFSGYNSKKQFLHLAIDHFTRFTWALCSKTQSSINFINLIKIISKTQTPKKILADRYTGIKSKEFIHFLEKQNIEYVFTTTDCPQSNGMVERLNQTLVNRLRCKLNDNNKNKCWPKLLEEVITEYNNTPHSSTRFSPCYLMFGIPPFESPIKSPLPCLEEARRLAFENSFHMHQKNKNLYDKTHRNINIEKGDLVYVKRGSEISRKKLEPIRMGPYEVIEKLSDVSFKIRLEKGKVDIFHIKKLWPYKPP